MMDNKKFQLNILEILQKFKWIVHNDSNSTMFKIEPPKKLGFSHGFALYIPKNSELIDEKTAKEINSTFSQIYNFNETFCFQFLNTKNVYEMNVQTLKKELQSIKNKFESVKFYSGKSFVYPNSFVIITFNQDKDSYVYEYFVVFIKDNIGYRRGIKTRYTQDMVDFIGKSPKQFAFEDALTQSKIALYSLISKKVGEEESRNNYFEIREATNLIEVSPEDVFYNLIGKRNVLDYLAQSQSEELKSLVNSYSHFSILQPETEEFEDNDE